MDGDAAIQLVVIIILIGLSAFFSSSETALVSCNKIRMKNLSDSGDKKAATVLRVTENQPKMLSAILIGNNIVNISASALATLFATNHFGSAAVGASTGVLTLLVLLFGEITPKSAASVNADQMALGCANIIGTLMTLLTPVIWLVNLLSGLVQKLLRINTDGGQNAITEEELRTIVDMSHEEGVIESDEKQMITNVFDFGDQAARDIMIPRVDMTCVDVEAGYDEVISIFREEKYTRMPVYEDDTDNVIGILNIKDLFLQAKNDGSFSLRSLMREPLYAFELKKVSKLMTQMRESSSNVAIVLNEYGSCVGMITLEDMLEEIVGDIHDEYDAEEEEENKRLRVGENEYLVDGSMKLDDLNELMGTKLVSEDYDSIGGYLTEHFEHLPDQGEELTEGNLRFVIEEANDTRVEKVRIFILDEAKSV
ncbi:MAG: hemolysin family protein [Eubacteriales bacterium]|nr:hemolysin family protein [Eubacteriales bacterium]